MDGARRDELAVNLARVRERIARACAAARRDPTTVTMVAVTKTYPADDVVRLADLGVVDVGENRDQEAGPKAAAVATAGARVRWHFVGRLQRNKCRSVAAYADVVHSVDGVRLAEALGEAARRRDRSVAVLLQVSIDGDPARGGAIDRAGSNSAGSSSAGSSSAGRNSAGSNRAGSSSTGTDSAGSNGAGTVDPDKDLDRVAAAVASAEALKLAGVMAVAPQEWEPEAAFARLAEISRRLRGDYPAAVAISAGMSGDLEAAIAHGATHVRIGSALLGMRAPLR